jgi:murein DD-endopeptidase MepM/ murein hydrolase activator NlpD
LTSVFYFVKQEEEFMKEKYLSLIIIPHKQGNQRIFSISKKTLKTVSIIIPSVCIILGVFCVDYLAMNKTRQKYKDLKTEYIKQKETIAQYRDSISGLKAYIGEFEQYRKKLNVIAGLKSPDKLEGEPGVGGPGNGQEIISPELNQDLSELQDITDKAKGISANFNTLMDHYESQKVELDNTPSIMPTQGYWASPYGWRNDPFTGQRAFHPGVDIATQKGNPVLATADGIIISTKNEKRGGKTIKISHTKTGYITVYCHLDKFLVKQGQRIMRGDIIGLVGNTGRTRSPHVHYEVRINGKKLNPWYYILDN